MPILELKRGLILSNLVCMSCQQPKQAYRRRKSKLTGGDLVLCSVCYELKYEPRWAVVVVARSQGIDAVSDWIKNKRYIGAEITVRELL